MTDEPGLTDDSEKGDPSGMNKFVRALASLVGGVIPIAGPFFQAGVGVWGEIEQERAYEALKRMIGILEDESREKQKLMLDLLARVDVHDEEIAARIRSDEYQALLKKALRGWSRTESVKKQRLLRDILSHAAATRLVTDDVISLFIEWVQDYSEFHFEVIAEIYRHPMSTRAEIWDELGRGAVREDSAEADLFKLLINDLSLGRIARQHRETTGTGEFILKKAQRATRRAPAYGIRVAKSAFDDKEAYELTAIGKQFVHYAMTDLPLKIAYNDGSPSGPVQV